jgi:hypothetical protein
MTKKELISQVLNENQTDLYLFWAVKLLKEYPEYKQKVLDFWINLGGTDKNIDNVVISDKGSYKRLYNGYDDTKFRFYYTSIDKDSLGYLNWTLKEEGYE